MDDNNTSKLFNDLINTVNKLISIVKTQQQKIDQLTEIVYQNCKINNLTEQNLLYVLEKHKTKLFKNDEKFSFDGNLNDFYNFLIDKHPDLIEYFNSYQNTENQ